MKWEGREPIFLAGVQGELIFHDRVLSHDVRLGEFLRAGSEYRILRPSDEYQVVIKAPIGNAALSFIESTRSDQDLPFNVQLDWSYHATTPAGPERSDGIGLHAGPIASVRRSISGNPLPRSEWMRVLAELEWSEVEIIELPKVQLSQHEASKRSLVLLVEAERSLRMADYGASVAKCRGAFESLAKYLGSGDAKDGFKVMLDACFPDGAFPGVDEHREIMNTIMHALAKLANLVGRHEQFPVVTATRDEAEFMLRSTVALFALLGRGLERNAACRR